MNMQVPAEVKAFVRAHGLRLARKCLNCGAFVPVPASRLNTGKYCNTECRIAHSHVNEPCAWCGDPVSVPGWRKRSRDGEGYKRVFCGRSCCAKYHGKKRSQAKWRKQLMQQCKQNKVK